MKSSHYFLLILALVFLLDLKSQAQNAGEITEMLAKTWYSYRVGEPGSSDLFETKNHEEMILWPDGVAKITVLHSRMGKMEYEASWKYNEEAHGIDFELEMNGQTEKQTINITELTSDKLLLTSSQKTTEYSTEMSAPFMGEPMATATPVEAVAVAESTSVNGLNMEEWSGTYVFEKATQFNADGSSETYPSKGEIILYMEDGKQMIKLLENGYEDILEVKEGTPIAGERHFGIITDKDYLAGEFVLHENGQISYYKDKDQTTVGYHLKK